MQRAGQLKGELVDFALSERFNTALDELVLDAFPDGIVDDEALGEGRRLGLEFTSIDRKRQGDLVHTIYNLEVQRAGS